MLMGNIGSYEEKYKNFEWQLSVKELEYGKDGMYNLAYYCSERICEKGMADKTALIWEGFQGNKKKYTYNDIRLYSNAIAQFLLDNGIKPEERICLFMDRIPELYISFLGVLKMGGIVQPLFSAFGEEALFTRLEDASTCAIFTTMKHIRKVRKILHKLPDLKYIFVVDAGNKKLEKFEISFNMEK